MTTINVVYQAIRLELIAGKENVMSLQETTWIGLQVSIPEKVELYNPKGGSGRIRVRHRLLLASPP